VGKTLRRGMKKLSILHLRDGGFGRRVSTSSGSTSGISSVVRSPLANVSGSSVRRPGNSVVDSRADPIGGAISLCLKCERDEVSTYVRRRRCCITCSNVLSAEHQVPTLHHDASRPGKT
jgi:hypothetical protein